MKQLKVAYRYDVKYSLICSDIDNEDFHRAFRVLGINSGNWWEEEFDCSAHEWNKAIDKIGHFKDLPEEEKDKISSVFMTIGITPTDMLDIMRNCRDAADPNNDFIHIQIS